MQTKPIKRIGKGTVIVDATPVDLDYNNQHKYRSKKYLEKRNLKWSYASSYWFFIGLKTTIAINYESTMPVAILIHFGAPHDSKIHRNDGKPPEKANNQKKAI